jgi:hypothetical protein
MDPSGRAGVNALRLAILAGFWFVEAWQHRKSPDLSANSSSTCVAAVPGSSGKTMSFSRGLPREIRAWGFMATGFKAYPDRKRCRDKEGMSDIEMLGFINDYLEDAALTKVVGSHFDRTTVETPGSHLRTVHAKLRRSLDAGFPPIVILRWFIAKEVKKPKKGDEKYNWWGMSGHWMAVVDIPRELEPGALSFTMKVADSWTGRRHDCFIHEEQFRNFTAAKGDDRKWVWPEVAQPYLIATLPPLPLGTKDMPWFLRSNVVLSYGIYRK